MYMNIADDVYRNRVEDLTLTAEQIDTILHTAEFITDEETKEKIKNSLERGEIYKTDYKRVINHIDNIRKGEIDE